MTIEFDDTRLPVNVEASAQFVMTSETFVSTGYGGNEERRAKRPVRWEASVTVNPDGVDDLIDIFNSQIGGRYAIRVRNNREFSATDQLLDPDDDGNYPVIRRYGTGVRERIRRIWAPVPGTLTVKLDGTPTSNSNWTLLPMGIVAPVASPDQGWEAYDVTLDYEFDIIMRINGDRADFTALTELVGRAQVSLIEVLG